jgi:transposase
MEAQDLACAQKKARREGRTIVFIDESGLSEKCPVTRTWAPRGQTPLIHQSFSWRQLSMMAALSWQGFHFGFVDGPVVSDDLIAFLNDLKRQIRKPLLVIWDQLPVHKSGKVQQWLAAQHGRIALAFLPPYAPELNPVEGIWGYLKTKEIANFCPMNLAEVSHYARRRLQSMQRRPPLIRSFWRQTGLAL